jgi:hypothetical protein
MPGGDRKLACGCLEKAMIAAEIESGGHAGRVRFGRTGVKRFCAGLAGAAVAALGAWASIEPARSAPPTVTPSPGYDARLQEQRAARVIHEPAVPYLKPVSRRRVKRMHGAH